MNPRTRFRLISMQSRLVGSTGLRVSRLGLGTMTWGRDTTPEQARGLLETFSEAGGTLIDTAAAYGAGDADGSSDGWSSTWATATRW